MSTNDVPGANPVNRDKLARGCWAEHEDGSMIYVKDIDENSRVIFEIYDFAKPNDPVYYPSALSLIDFEKTFSYDPKKTNKSPTGDIKWTWHDKKPMPWERVMREIDKPVPVSANVVDTLSAAARIADSLHLRMRSVINEDHIRAEQGLEMRTAHRTARGIGERLKNALSALVD